MIEATYRGHLKFAAAQERRALTLVMESLDKTGSAGRSASGWTAAMAINYCEGQKWPYQVTAYPGVGYIVERIKEDDR